jgi:peptidoglycan/LPS O-acetylase OafA/YrhL
LSTTGRFITGLTCVFAASLSTWYDRGNIVVVLLATYLLIVNAQPLQISRFTKFSKLILGNRMTRLAADMSYSVYLFHGFFISHIGYFLFTRHEFDSLSPISRFACLLAGVVISTCLFSILTHCFVECPFIKLGKQIANIFDSRLRSSYVGQPS